MTRLHEILSSLELLAPARYAFPWDKIGLQVGDRQAPITRAVVSLDRSLGAVAYAESQGAELLLTHHPLLFDPVATVTSDDVVGRTLGRLIKSNIALVSAHTNWDAARGGINDALAGLLGLQDVTCFGTAAPVAQLKMVVTCPLADVDRLIDAASAAGAGIIGEYRRCAFASRGDGTFIGSTASHPTVGTAGAQETVSEVRIEMRLRADQLEAVRSSVLSAHPYEEPALDFYPVLDHPEQPAGRIGVLNSPITLDDFVKFVDINLHTQSWAWGRGDRQVRKVAVVGGGADGEFRAALRAGADVFVTGEVRQHVALEAVELGLAIVASGHYATEQPGCAALRDRMSELVPDVQWELFVPPAGEHGRPR